jgi:hypothetical protein
MTMERHLPVLWGVSGLVAAALGSTTVAAQEAPEKPASSEEPAPQKAAPAPATPASATAPVVDNLARNIEIRCTAAEALARAGDIPAARELLRTNEKDLSALNAEAKTAVEETVTAKAVLAQKNATETTDKAGEATCGGGTRFRPCLYVGAFVASGSLTTFSVGSLHGGKTAHTLVSTAIPAMGIRIPLDKRARFSAELGLLSMLLSKDITATNQRGGCKTNDGDFEKHLSCEGNVSLSPVVGGYLGLTAGTSDIGLLTLMPMAGFAMTSLDGSMRPYVGVAIGLVNLSKTFNFF